ncbi:MULTISPECIES: hypothetical protein [Leptolyngbya]|uniref:hypothetical protein n=1 Tax=Leptolyngbya TaxID=47251 RepID=UPI00035C1734|nr:MULTISPECIES: hypothetical protein [Leptolyngbya]MBD2366081.1 hypothetical protein [Leptolyngbya sp. FACHB-161]MBD2372261.1 hypothetical protein [Leptolyngbya sp. FACHB-238]MBD2396684.1 hypothetical protein [Leptolyngbya sp. FACHB-239]MBD2403207.1 hypothetical protein [Leptolyngbya sp. FACHB-402]ULP32007.1 hypothetical protein MCP04_09645 [Leptolyngbya boryana IU 594]
MKSPLKFLGQPIQWVNDLLLSQLSGFQEKMTSDRINLLERTGFFRCFLKLCILVSNSNTNGEGEQARSRQFLYKSRG